jgi:hypothetical protein
LAISGGSRLDKKSPNVARGSRKGHGLFRSFIATHLFRSRPPAGNVIPVEKLRRRSADRTSKEPHFGTASFLISLTVPMLNDCAGREMRKEAQNCRA